MEQATLQAFLRVLYTVNNNPQYILAKSSSQVPTIICNESTTQSESIYARAPLKACLAAVCDSSPELLQDPTRDFSLYILDPLETQPPFASLAQASQNTTNSPRGVAVALGLMSWALESNDSTNVFVTGTVIPNASPALEVIFALRETKRMPRPTLHSYPSLGSVFASGSSQPLNTHFTPQATWMNWLSTSQFQHGQQQQRTLTRSADFPELYIGPPRRAPGRPEGSTSSKSKSKSQTSISSHPGPSSNGADTQPESKQEVGKRSKQKTKPRPPRPPPTCSPFICGPLKRNIAAEAPGAGTTGAPAFYQQSHPFPTQPHPQPYLESQAYSQLARNPLLELVSAISSDAPGNTATNTGPMPQAALLSALQGLIAANPHLLQLAVTNTAPVAAAEEQASENKPMEGENNADDENGDADSDIVILDSSTVDATAFHKPNHQELASSEAGMSPPTANQESPSIQDTVPSPLPVSTPSGLEGTPASPQTSTPTASPEAKTTTTKHVSWKNETAALSQAPDIPATPNPSRSRKRKLDEYFQGPDPLIPASPPSPSPPMTRTSSSRRALTARRVPSSPTRGTNPVSSPSVRLPSMLGSMRSMTTSNSRLQTTSPGYSKQSKAAVAFLDIASATTSLRRRLNLNLNEVMEQHEAQQNAKVRKRTSSGRKFETERPMNALQAGASRPSKLVPTSGHAKSSPPRPLFRSDPVPSFPVSTTESGKMPGAAMPIPPATTPASMASTSTTSPMKNPLKNFIMPAWARTGTALLPRLSEEALARQRAEREAKKAQVSLRRREAARAKRQRLRGAVHPSKESSDEDDDADANDPKPRTLHPSSSVGWCAPLPPPTPSLPVFASDAVAPIPSSPPQTQRQAALPVVPSTPPRKSISPTSALHRTPNKSGSCSLFTPSGQEPGSLFTPSTPSVTPSLTRATFTPHSPTVFLRSSPRKSPRKSMPQTPRTPKRSVGIHQTPRSLRSGRNVPFASPSLTMGTRAFLLPPPSPSRTLHSQNHVHSRGPGSGSSPVTKDSGNMDQESPGGEHSGPKKEDALLCKSDNKLHEGDMSILPAEHSPTRPAPDGSQETRKLCDIASGNEATPAREEYASSPLPPSSPLPTSPLSSPAKHHDSDVDIPSIDNLVPDSDILLPSASDSDAPQDGMDMAWPSDNACTPAWLADSETSAWLTETEAWLTDTEGGGPLLTDSDGAWFSDSDAVFGDMSSLPPSSASNWLSDDADVDTDVEGGEMQGADADFDTAAFERAFAALVECGGRSVGTKGEDVNGGAATGTKVTNDAEFWESIRPLLGENASEGAGATTDGDAINEAKVARDLQQLLDGLVSVSN